MKRKKPELLSACVIAASLLLCMGVSLAEYLTVREQAQEARAAVAAVRQPKGFQQAEDPLLVVVNGDVALPADWEVTPKLIDDEQVDLRMYRDLTEMFHAAEEEEIWFWVASGYRSVEEQELIWERAVQENRELGMDEEEAQREAARTIARPGHSEHHTGLAVDLNDVSAGFAFSPAYAWLQQNAADYGFVQRYQKGKEDVTGIDCEPWHYRYVGREHAKEMERLGLCLEEYAALLRERGR